MVYISKEIVCRKGSRGRIKRIVSGEEKTVPTERIINGENGGRVLRGRAIVILPYEEKEE